jgi:Type II secretion system protein B
MSFILDALRLAENARSTTIASPPQITGGSTSMHWRLSTAQLVYAGIGTTLLSAAAVFFVIQLHAWYSRANHDTSSSTLSREPKRASDVPSDAPIRTEETIAHRDGQHGSSNATPTQDTSLNPSMALPLLAVAVVSNHTDKRAGVQKEAVSVSQPKAPGKSELVYKRRFRPPTTLAQQLVAPSPSTGLADILDRTEGTKTPPFGSSQSYAEAEQATFGPSGSNEFYDLSKLPPEIQSAVRGLNIKLIFYTTTAAQRVAIVDGRTLREGDDMKISGFRLEEIAAGALILNFRGHRLRANMSAGRSLSDGHEPSSTTATAQAPDPIN